MEIVLDQVSFGYDQGSEVLHNLNLRIRQGEHVLFSGRTGAGKSTLFKLLLGIYVPDQGRVTINGIPPQVIIAEERRKLFGYVEQHFSIVEGSIGEQISLFDTRYSEEEIWKELELCEVAEKVRSMPQGIHTCMDASVFSQGELQLMSIARALVAKPQIMLLDEITANLDSVTEQKILHVLRDASKGRTVLSISHRMKEQLDDSRIIQI